MNWSSRIEIQRQAMSVKIDSRRFVLNNWQRCERAWLVPRFQIDWLPDRHHLLPITFRLESILPSQPLVASVSSNTGNKRGPFSDRLLSGAVGVIGQRDRVIDADAATHGITIVLRPGNGEVPVILILGRINIYRKTAIPVEDKMSVFR